MTAGKYWSFGDTEVLILVRNARIKDMIKDINRTLRSEKQTALEERTSRGLSYRLLRWRKDSYFYKILELFYGLPTEELKVYGIQGVIKILNISKDTTQKWFKVLKREGFIRIVAKNVGTNKSEKFYIITNEGELAFESYERSLLI